MEESIGGLLPRKQQEWKEDLDKSRKNVKSAEVISREMERCMPCYLFLVLDLESSNEKGRGKPKGRLTFYTRDDRPFNIGKDGKAQWYQILTDNLPYVRLKVKELVPTVEVRDGVEGYVVPLQESPSFGKMEDVISFQRNLMFWESMLGGALYGPMAGRLAFLARDAYRMPNEQRKIVVNLGGHEVQTGKKKRVVKAGIRYFTTDENRAGQQRQSILSEKVKQWLATSEQDMKEEKQLQAKLKLRLVELQQMCMANEALSKEGNNLLEKLNRGDVGKVLR
ncbi:MAG: hypothetical protein IJZ38_02650 [Bacteroides sp.]|nr:hypothetical protein [Bacteroides sp.]